MVGKWLGVGMTRPSQELGREARTAAKWWADKLRDDFTPDNGDTDPPEGSKDLITASRAVDRRYLSASAIDAFEAALAVRVQTMLNEEKSPYETAMRLGVDYRPSRDLAECLEEAGIPARTTTLPWKTCMWVQPGSVRVGDGYGVGPRELELLP